MCDLNYDVISNLLEAVIRVKCMLHNGNSVGLSKNEFNVNFYLKWFSSGIYSFPKKTGMSRER